MSKFLSLKTVFEIYISYFNKEVFPSQLLTSAAAYFILNPGTAVCYMFQVFSIYNEIISMGYSKDNVTDCFNCYSFGFI